MNVFIFSLLKPNEEEDCREMRNKAIMIAMFLLTVVAASQQQQQQNNKKKVKKN